MSLERCNPECSRSDEEYNKYFSAFLKAVEDKNVDLINSLIMKEGILQRQFYYENVTFLHIVAKQGTVETAIKLCELGSDVNLKNISGESPIYQAIKHSTEMVKILVDNGAKVNIKCNKGVTPLHLALLCASEETISLIVNTALSEIHKYSEAPYEVKTESCNIGHFKPKSELSEGKKAKMLAILDHRTELNLSKKDYPLLILFGAKTGNEDFFKSVLNHCREGTDFVLDKTKKRKSRKSFYRRERYAVRPPEELNYQGYFDRTALHYAVREQLPQVVKFLIKAGADVNCRTRDHFTPLHYAVSLQNCEICEILLSFGAHVNQDSLQKSPLYLVCGTSENRVLLNPGGGYYYEEYSNTYRKPAKFCPEPTRTFHTKIMKILLSCGADPDFIGDEGMTPLLEACKAGNLEAVKILLECGANFRIRDEENNSSLHYAAIGKSVKIVDLLLEKGLDVDVRNNDEYSPFMLAVQSKERCLEVVEYLADLGADVNARNANTATALHIACYFECPDFVECLLELGADAKLECNFNCMPALGVILNNSIPVGMHEAVEILIHSIALNENCLGDYIKNYYILDDAHQAALSLFEKSKSELKKLKSRKMVQGLSFSFHDFLTRDFYSAVQIMKNEEVRQVFRAGEYEFSCYSYLLRKRFERVEALEEFVDKTEDFLQNFGNVRIPILPVRKILGHLRSSDFRIFGRILHR